MKIALLGVIAMLFLMAAGKSQAQDWKAFTATQCQPYGTTTAADLSYSGYGVTNKSTTASKSVICPLVSDYEGVVDATHTAAVWLGFSSGATSGNVYCAVYIGTKGSGLVSQSVNTAWIAPNSSSDGNYSLTFSAGPPAGSYPALPAVAICTLSARTSLNALWLQENGETDDAAS